MRSNGKGKGGYNMQFIRDRTYIELQYAVNKQAIKDLAEYKSNDSARYLTDYLLTHYIDSKEKMERIVVLSLLRRFIKMLREIAKELDRMEVKVNHMRMTLDDLFKDMEQTARHVEKMAQDKESDNEADKIEEALEEDENESEDDDENESEDEDTDETIKNENMED